MSFQLVPKSVTLSDPAFKVTQGHRFWPLHCVISRYW